MKLVLASQQLRLAHPIPGSLLSGSNKTARPDTRHSRWASDRLGRDCHGCQPL